MKSIGLNAKENISLNKDVKTQFEPRKNANFFETFYSELISNLVKNQQLRLTKLIAVPLTDFVVTVMDKGKHWHDLERPQKDHWHTGL